MVRLTGATVLHSPFAPLQVVSISEKVAINTSGAVANNTDFALATQRTENTSLNSLAPLACRACSYRFDGMAANKHLSTSYQPETQHLSSRWKCQLPESSIFAQLKICPLSVWLWINLHLGTEILFPTPLKDWQVLAHPKILRATKNKVSGLDNHKCLRGNQELGQSWIVSFTSF